MEKIKLLKECFITTFGVDKINFEIPFSFKDKKFSLNVELQKQHLKLNIENFNYCSYRNHLIQGILNEIFYQLFVSPLYAIGNLFDWNEFSQNESIIKLKIAISEFAAKYDFDIKIFFDNEEIIDLSQYVDNQIKQYLNLHQIISEK